MLREIVQLVQRHAERVDPVDLERARSQVIVRLMRHDERLTQRIDDAALDLFALQRVRSAAERVEQVRALGAEQVREAFAHMQRSGVSVALAGSVGRAGTQRVREAVGA